MDELTDREHEILEFENQHFRHTGAKEDLVRDQFALKITNYYQQVNNLIDRPESLAAYPQLVYRLRRRRARRAAARASRSFGLEDV